MPWPNDIDDTRPTDLEFVSEGAERFRELKLALIERFLTAYKGFPDNDPDNAGTNLLFPIASVRVGMDAEKPAVPERQGAGWFSTDTGILWVADDTPEWQQVADPAAQTDEEKRVNVGFSGTVALASGTGRVTGAIMTTAINGREYFPREFFVQFRNESGGDWSRYYQMHGHGHTDPAIATVPTITEYSIPNTDAAVYHGSSIYFEEGTDNLRINVRIQQGSGTPSAANLEYRGVCQFHRMTGIILTG